MAVKGGDCKVYRESGVVNAGSEHAKLNVYFHFNKNVTIVKVVCTE